MSSTEDWLSEILNDLHFTALAHIDGSHASDDSHVLKAKAKIRQHTLSEALELIGEDENDHVENWDCSCGANHSLHHTYSRENRLRAELRQQFNKQWGKK